MRRGGLILGKCCLTPTRFVHAQTHTRFLISGSHKPQVRLCNSITVGIRRFVGKEERRPKGTSSAWLEGLLSVLIVGRRAIDLECRDRGQVGGEKAGNLGESGVASVKGKSLSWKG